MHRRTRSTTKKEQKKECVTDYDSDSNASTGTCNSISKCWSVNRYKKILKRHVRPTSGNETHECKICNCSMTILVGSGVDGFLLKCPSCDEIYHAICIKQYLSKSEYIPSCPNCRLKIDDYSVLNEWEISDDWIENFYDSDEEEYIPKSRKIRTSNMVLRSHLSQSKLKKKIYTDD